MWILIILILFFNFYWKNFILKISKKTDFSVDSLSLIDKEQENSDSIIFNKITNHLKNEKSQTIDNLVDELFYDREKQNFLEKKKSSNKSNKEKEKEANQISDMKKNIAEKANKEQANIYEKPAENSKIKKNKIDKIEGNDNKNHIFETDFPEEDERNKDIRYNPDLLAKNDVNIPREIDLIEVRKIASDQIDYKKIDNGNIALSKHLELSNLINDNKNLFEEKKNLKNDKHFAQDNSNINADLNLKNKFDLNIYYDNDLNVNENIYKKGIKLEDSNDYKYKMDDLQLNIYANKQININKVCDDKNENGKFNKNVNFLLKVLYKNWYFNKILKK